MFADFLTVEWAPTSAPFDPAPTWVDITSFAKSCRAFSGLRGPTDLLGSGTLTLDVNNDLGGGDWIDKDVWYRSRQIRVYTADSVLFAGWITRIVPNYGFRDGISLARIEAVDAIGLLASGSTDADFATYVAGSPIGVWAARSINNRDGYVGDGGCAAVADWLLAPLAVDFNGTADGSRMPVFVEAKQSGNALQLLQDFLEAEQGRLISFTGGSSVFVSGRYHEFGAAGDDPAATFADDGTGFRYLLDSLVLSAPDETYIDDCTYGGQGIDNQRTASTPADYPPATFVRTSQSPIADVNWALANTELIVTLGKQTGTYPRSLACQVTGPTYTSYDPLHPAIVGQVGFPFDVLFKGSTYKVVATSMEHTVDTKTGWKCVFTFRSLDRIIAAYGGSSVFIVGTSEWGGPDIFGP